MVLGMVCLLFWQVTIRLGFDSLGAVLLATVVNLGLILWFVCQFARSIRSTRSALAWIFVAALLTIPPRILFGLRMPIPPPWSWLILLPGADQLLFALLAAAFGAALSRVVRYANMIPPVAVVLVFVDLWTVLGGGPVQRVMESSSPAAKAVTRAMVVPLPSPKSTKRNMAPIALAVGFADFLFVAFFIAAIGRFVPTTQAYARSVVVLIAVLCIYMLAVVITDTNLPALVPVGIVLIALHARQFRYERSEAFALLYAGILLAAVLGGLFWMSRRNAEPPPPPALQVPASAV
jgi:hypothetical protein